MPTARSRSDRCPGVLRPWPAADGMLVRLRLIGGRVTSQQLRSLARAAERYGDGMVHVTSRANVQVRAFPGTGDRLDEAVLAALESTGLLPTRTHERVRNVMVSPQTGLAGGRTDLRPVAATLDRLVCGDPVLAALPGRFLFVLDDGRGDLVDRTADLGLVALDRHAVQLRTGGGWGEVVSVDRAAERLAALAHEFVVRRGTGPAAPWHIAELDAPLTQPAPADPRLPRPGGHLPYGAVAGGQHVQVPATGLDRVGVDALTADAAYLIVTPWRGVLVPEEQKS